MSWVLIGARGLLLSFFCQFQLLRELLLVILFDRCFLEVMLSNDLGLMRKVIRKMMRRKASKEVNEKLTDCVTEPAPCMTGNYDDDAQIVRCFNVGVWVSFSLEAICGFSFQRDFFLG